MDVCMTASMAVCLKGLYACVCLSVCMHACVFVYTCGWNVYGLGIIYIYIHTSRGLYSLYSVDPVRQVNYNRGRHPALHEFHAVGPLLQRHPGRFSVWLKALLWVCAILHSRGSCKEYTRSFMTTL